VIVGVFGIGVCVAVGSAVCVTVTLEVGLGDVVRVGEATAAAVPVGIGADWGTQAVIIRRIPVIKNRVFTGNLIGASLLEK
jgi:hypothetical protein